MPNSSKSLRWSLKQIGLSDAAINAAWPTWWSDAADSSASARAELRFSLSRKLGLDPKSLLNDQPKFVWLDKAKFKNLSNEDSAVKGALASFGTSVGSMFIQALAEGSWPKGLTALELRTAILRAAPFVRLQDLLAFCWGVGIPVIHLRVFPLSAKHMCAMVVKVGSRFAVLLAKDSVYPAPVSYYVAHELGHIALGHLNNTNSLVDLQDPLEAAENRDEEEKAADRFALELLTGRSDPKILTEAKKYTASELARVILATSEKLQIEPGTLALCFGYSNQQWPRAMAAMKSIYTGTQPAWSVVNSAAKTQLDWSDVPEDSASFARAVMGGLK